jgi:hypothetical protein
MAPDSGNRALMLAHAAAMLTLLAACGGSSPAGQPAPPGPLFLSPPDCVTSANMVAEAAAEPKNQTHLRVQNIGDPGTAERAGEIANPVTWNVGELSGFDARSVTGAQRGYRDAGLPDGASAFQLHCDHAGFLINTWQFSHAAPLVGEGPSATVGRSFAPLVPAFRNGAALFIEADIKVPWILNARTPVVDGTAQVSFLYYLRDAVSGKEIAHVVQLFENRAPAVGGAGVENLNFDGVVNFASSPLSPLDSLGRPVRYATVAAGSAQMQYQQPWSESRRFRAVITHANIAAALADLRAMRQPELSPEPSDYSVTFFGVLGEVFPGTGNDDNVALAASVSGLSLGEIPRAGAAR